MDIAAASDQLADLLETAGIRAVTDPRAVVAPCALVEVPADVDMHHVGASSATCTITVTLIAAANDVRWLTRNVVTAMAAVGATHATTFQYPYGDDAHLPAYAMTATVTVNE